uniref:Tyrosinase copper-binding domain-containing protein n=1 Tax=Strongyloides stercoralis TaxID=6248 RepID=A0A0K0E814_STRER
MIIKNNYILIVIIFFGFIILQTKCIDCSKAPSLSLMLVCWKVKKWDKESRKISEPSSNNILLSSIFDEPSPIFAPLVASINKTANQCMDIICVCSFFNGKIIKNKNDCILPNKKKLSKSIRKELRMLTKKERERYHRGIKKLKESGEYTNFATIHSKISLSGSSHAGPAFLPWHREFLKRFEIALKKIDPSLSIPYWDSTLESSLPTPEDSIIFSDIFFGTTDDEGNVVTGPFKNFTTISGNPYISRDIGRIGSVFKDSEIDILMNKTSINEMLVFPAARNNCSVKVDFNGLEFIHGNIHNFIGGDMFLTATSGNDPIFYHHHSFVDLIWEMWRKHNQNKEEREKVYPNDMSDCFSELHFGTNLMKPFEEWRNIDGLKNEYTDNMYEYAPRPTCSLSNPSCKSEFLFCYISNNVGKCTAKIKINGNCKGFEEVKEACYKGICINGTCTSKNHNKKTSQTQLPALNNDTLIV